jgi:hypothetical protein
MEQASMPSPDFFEFARVQRWRRLSRQIGFLENALRSYGNTPDFWARDIELYISSLREAVQDENRSALVDSSDNHNSDEACRASQRMVFNFGHMLHWWPEIVDVAKRLRARGQRLAVMI